LNTWMYTIREIEHGLDSCQGDCTSDDCVGGDATGSIDEAAAFYTGSLEGAQGTLGEGALLYALANKRCQNFKTCGSNGNEISGNSKVNIEIMKQLAQLSDNLANNKCDDARKNKDRIIQLMSVPLVQGVLRYADKMANDPEADEGARLEGATFAAAVLPTVHNCSAADAETIYQNMGANTNQAVDFAAVKGAFERNYGCMGITCAEVGGVIDEGTGTYKSGAAPCGNAGATSSSSSVNVGLAVGLSVGAVVAILLVYLWCKCCRKSSMIESKSGDDQVVA
jgi:Low iron-inducible periplasmic protein